MVPPIPTPLPAVKRYITTHDSKGNTTFTTAGQKTETVPWEAIGGTRNYGLVYTTSSTPTKLQDDQDVSLYQDALSDKPGMIIHNGTVLRYCDYPPNAVSAMHRTISIDYGVVIEGQIEILLDSGEKRIMNRGDVCVQRSTMHGWRNPSSSSWSRVLFVLMHAETPVVAGKALAEEYGNDRPGMKKSGSKI